MAKDDVLKVSIVISRCSREKRCFGIRFEQTRHDIWGATWAFPIKESAAKKEGYNKTELKGGFELKEGAYPGCPHCGAYSIFQCGKCGKTSCWDAESRTVTCPWCSNEILIEGYIEKLGASSDG